VPSTSTFQLENTNANGPADLAFGYCGAGSLPMAVDWDGTTGPGGVDGQIEDDRAAGAAIRHVMETIGGRMLNPIAISGCSWHAP